LIPSFLTHSLESFFLSFLLSWTPRTEEQEEEEGGRRTRRKRELGNKGVEEWRRSKEAARKQTLKNWLAGLWNSAVDR